MVYIKYMALKFKYLIIITVFISLISPKFTYAINHLTLTTISDLEKSEMNQEYESERINTNDNSEDKLVLKDINKTSKSPISFRTISFIVFIIIIIFLGIKLLM